MGSSLSAMLIREPTSRRRRRSSASSARAISSDEEIARADDADDRRRRRDVGSRINIADSDDPIAWGADLGVVAVAAELAHASAFAGELGTRCLDLRLGALFLIGGRREILPGREGLGGEGLAPGEVILCLVELDRGSRLIDLGGSRLGLGHAQIEAERRNVEAG